MYPALKYSWGRMVLGLLFFPFLFSCTTVRFAGKPTDYSPGLRYEGVLSPELIETSGLEFHNHSFWSFNDSGGEAALYSFSSYLQDTARKTVISGVTNRDWEDIGQDSVYMYIADTGNNFGERDTLVIYRLKKGVLSEDTISPEASFRIVFSEKTEEFRGCSRNPFDCEALIVANDSLYLFTKNWQDESSWIYAFPAIPGQYTLERSSVLQPEMLVTGASIKEDDAFLWLVGYHNWQPSMAVYHFEDSRNHRQIMRIRFHRLFGIQAEGICEREGRIYFSFEKSIKRQGMYSINAFP